MGKHPEIKVAISADFLKAFSRVPRSQQNKVRKFLDEFQENPASPGINYETISGCADANLRSCRIDQTYRAIILKPQTGNVYMLLWVDVHDDAYDWAKRRKLIIHPDTGGLQIVQVQEDAAEAAPAAPETKGKAMLFDDFRDRQLLRLGLPEELLALVRGVASDSDLDKLEDQLPQEAYECLYLLAGGIEYEEVVADYERSQEEKVDTEDFAAALDNLDSQRRFKVVEGELELQELLNAPLDEWRVFLHPTQRKIVEMNVNGPVRVLGGAGTGKTVVAVHRAKWLATMAYFQQNERILFTTYTKNLAQDIQDYLRAICPTDVLKRIDVINLDAWVSQYLKKSGYSATIAINPKVWEKLWEEALIMRDNSLDLSDTFYRDEWEQVIQAQGISNVKEYFKATRTGRGRRLSREQKLAVWNVFEEYRALLTQNNISEIPDAYRDCRQILAKKGSVLGYSAVLVDEAQDFGDEAFKLIRQIAPEQRNDIFIVGDAHQRIYGHPVVLGRCGIKITGRSRKLKINYRTTDETRNFAVSVLRGVPIDDLDGGEDNNKGYKSLTHGPAPQVFECDSEDKEGTQIRAIIKQITDDGGELSGICICARTNRIVEHYCSILEAAGISHSVIAGQATHDQSLEGIRLATMHRVKGIEFDHVIVAGANDGVIPLKSFVRRQENKTGVNDAEARERALLYVSLTRARKTAYVTSSSTISPFISS